MQIRKLQSGHERWLQTPDCAVIYTGEDGARGSAPVSRRWRIVRETKTGGTSGGRVAPARGRWARGTVEEVAAGGHQRARRRRARTGTANRDSHSPLPFVSFFHFTLGRGLSTFFFSEVGHLCAITSELDLFVIGPVAESLALWIFFFHHIMQMVHFSKMGIYNIKEVPITSILCNNKI
jgi:hypothetical protein